MNKRQRFSFVFSLVIAAASSLVSAATRIEGVPDPDAELERQSFKLADGWEINLFASDPMLAKPIQMNFDPQGRLWVATSSTYPQIKPGQEASDKIIVLEDTKGAGRADKATVFADHLLIPTGLAPGDGGVYVANSTELLFLKDTDGDGKADTTRVMLSGFGTEDTHHIIHTFRWGPDGMLYFNQSIYIHSHIETPWGVRRLMAGGIWQLRPETQQLEIFARGWVNAWGHQFDRWGQSFAVDGAGGEGINYVIPGAYYTTAYGASRTLQGLNPGQPKLCSDEILSGRHIPPEYLGSILTNDFRGHRIARFVISDDGSGFASRRVADFLTTTHAAFRPVDLKMGPDGAIYIADFYNPIINHGEVDFRDPRRDTTHGRIWRVTYKGRPLVDRPVLVGVTVPQLLELLKTPEDYTRQQAKRVLKERGAKDVLPALAAWVKSLDPKDAEFDHQRLEALWVYQSLDVVEPELLKAVLGSSTPEARAAAVRVIAGWKDRVSDAAALLAAAVNDAHPRVRLEAVNTLRALGTGPAVELAMNALDMPMDKFLDYSLWLTAKELQPVWLADFSAGKLTFGGNPAHITFALKATGNTAAVAPLVKLLKDGKIDAVHRPDVIQAIAGLGSLDDAAVLLDIAMSDTALRPVTLAALEQAARQRNLRPAGDPKAITTLLDPADPAAPVAARLAGFWKLEAARPRLGELASAQTAPALRAAAIEGLTHLGGPASVKSLTDLTNESQPLPIRIAALVGLAQLDVKLGATRAAEVLATLPADTDCSAVFDAFIQRQDGPPALIDALKGKSLPAPIAAAGVRRAATAGRDLKPLTDAITAAGGLGQMIQHLTPEQMTQMVADVKVTGDASRGEAVFRRAAMACTTCHAIAGAGGRVAPDLVSLGASAPVDYIIESILEPSAKIKEGYAMTVVTTKDNQILAGLLVRRSETEAILRDITGKETTIPAGRIAKLDINPTSLMPPGLTATLRRDEFIDLVRFLSELGKEGAYQVGKAPVVRTWRTLSSSPAAESKLESKGTTLALGDDPALTWQPAYSTVAGVLPLADLPVIKRWDQRLAFVRFQIDVTTAGRFTFQLGDVAGLELWADDKSLKVASETTAELSAGPHTLTVAIDLAKRTAPLRIELAPGSGSTGKATILGGP